jgi:Mg-chelatase subunit ChlD
MSDDERARRWRLVLGPSEGLEPHLDGLDGRRDDALAAVLDAPRPGPRAGGLGSSAPALAGWLAEVRTLFPAPAARMLEAEAIERVGLARILEDPGLLEHVAPDARLAAAVLSLRGSLPARLRDAARAVVRRCVDDLAARIGEPVRASVRGVMARARASRTATGALDWPATIRANLRHHQPALGAPVLERRIARARSGRGLREVTICLDQSASMAGSVVHAGVLASVLASIPAVRTRLLGFDTAVVDLGDHLHDPVELLLGVQLGGGTDLGLALAAAAERLERPAQAVVFLVSDLFDGAPRERTLARAERLVARGARLVVLLALGDDGAPAHDAAMAQALARLGAPALACTPEHLPALLARALEGRALDR